MHLATEPLSPANLAQGVHLWPDRAAFTAAEFDRALETSTMLLEQERAQGALIRADGHPYGIGMSVFVEERFADAWIRRPEPHLGKRLLLTESLPESPILTVPQIADRNAGVGLQLVVVFTQIVGAPADRPFVLGMLIQAFVETHVGFRIQRVLNEVFGAGRQGRCRRC